MVFHWSLNDNKSPQVFRTLLSILVNLNNAVVCMVLSLSLIINSSSLLSKPLETVPSIPTTIDIPVTSCKVQVFFQLFAFFHFHSVVNLYSKIHIDRFLFLFNKTKSGLLAWIVWSICTSKYKRILCISFSWTDSDLCVYYLLLWSNFNL